MENALVKVERELKEFRASGYNLLVPAIRRDEVNPIYRPVLEVVQLSVNPADKDVYTSTFCKDGEMALAKNGVLKLADIGRVTPVPQLCRRLDDQKDPAYVCFQFVVSKRFADGTPAFQTGMKEVDLREGGSVEAGLWKVAEKKLSGSWEGKYPNRKWNPNKPEFKNRREAEEWVARELLAAREHKLSNAETKAQLRAIRALLQIRPAYPIKQLEKPFVCLHWDLDYNAPDVRSAAIASAMDASKALYGGGAQAQEKPRMLPTPQFRDEEDDGDLGEISADYRVEQGDLNETYADDIPLDAEAVFDVLWKLLRNARNYAEGQAAAQEINRQKAEGNLKPDEFHRLSEEAKLRLSELRQVRS